MALRPRAGSPVSTHCSIGTTRLGRGPRTRQTSCASASAAVSAGNGVPSRHGESTVNRRRHRSRPRTLGRRRHRLPTVDRQRARRTAGPTPPAAPPPATPASSPASHPPRSPPSTPSTGYLGEDGDVLAYQWAPDQTATPGPTTLDRRRRPDRLLHRQSRADRAAASVGVSGVTVTIPNVPDAGDHAGMAVTAPNAAVAAGIAKGLSYLGTPYVWGGGTETSNGPTDGCDRGGGALNSCQGTIGFDCSGLTSNVMAWSGSIGTRPVVRAGQRGEGGAVGAGAARRHRALPRPRRRSTSASTPKAEPSSSRPRKSARTSASRSCGQSRRTGWCIGGGSKSIAAAEITGHR